MSQEKEHDQEQESSRFKVDDRRLFTSEGEPIKREAGDKEERSSRSSQEREQASSQQTVDAGRAAGPQESVDFSSFIISLATSAMAYLGEVPDPATGQKVENLDGAKQMIDILSMLKEKTEGNLEQDEDRLLSSLLYEMRMKYLGKAKVIKL